MSINRVVISGNLTRDPELRRAQSGMEILSWGMAVNDRRRNQQSGEWEDYANFVDVTMFGSRASALAGILQKGMKVMVEGKLRWSQWQDKQGNNRSKLEVIADEVDIPPKGSSQGGHQQQAGNYAQPTQTPSQGAAQQQVGFYDSDIPF